jgi:hypothetical protein
MDKFWLYFLVFILSLASRIILWVAKGKLFSSEKKVLDHVYWAWTISSVIGMSLLRGLMKKWQISSPTHYVLVLLIAIITYLIVMYLYSYFKLRNKGLPKRFFLSYLLAIILQIIALALILPIFLK